MNDFYKKLLKFNTAVSVTAITISVIAMLIKLKL